jgi:hypothetical protein
MFSDEGNDRLADYTEADRKADIAARKKSRTPRREPYVPLQIACRFCGGLFKVNPVLVVGGVYSCDKCTENRGR